MSEELENKWAAKMDEQEQLHIAEKDELNTENRQTMYKALEEARQRWQKVYIKSAHV